MIRQCRGTIEQLLDLAWGLAFREREPCQQPVAGTVISTLLDKPPSKPCTMSKQRIEQVQNRTPVALVDMASSAKKSRSHGIRWAQGALDVTHKIKGGLEASGRDHGSYGQVKSATGQAREVDLVTVYSHRPVLSCLAALMAG